MQHTIYDALRRTRLVGRRLRDMETMRPEQADALLELASVETEDAAE